LLEGKRKVDESDHENTSPLDAEASAAGGKKIQSALPLVLFPSCHTDEGRESGPAGLEANGRGPNRSIGTGMRTMPRRKDTASKSEGVITESEINIIFSNIVEILNLNQILLQVIVHGFVLFLSQLRIGLAQL
jgi:hypothetical protein